ncbi:MAG: SAM-dependent methyltransferase [Myxococcaceae bacterium]
MAEFVFATCLPGVEPGLKREVARTRPELKFAYSRPGLVTFKSPNEIKPNDAPSSAFARVWGKSVGKAATPDEARQLLAAFSPTRFHVYSRDPEVPVDETAWQALGIGGTARDGEVVADIVLAPEEPAWLGVHRHDTSRSPHAGGTFPVDVPAESPSRAYAKIEEAIAWARLPMKKGETAVEIGAAPGGAVLALARRGLKVFGVDTAELAEQVRSLPNVHHIPKSVGQLRWEELPDRVEWLLMDVNLAPQVAVHEVARLIPPFRKTLLGAVFTLKMNDWAFVDDLPELTERIRQMGFREVRLRHLPSNRREVCAVAKR